MATHIVAAQRRARPSHIQQSARRLSSEVNGVTLSTAETIVDTVLAVLADPAPIDELLMRFVQKHQPGWDESKRREWVEETLGVAACAA